jgi:AraC-like DNA-binding protein
MKFEFNFYSSFLLIFFVHTTVYALLFLIRYKRYQQQSSLWLGLFLILAALYIAPWMLGFAGWYLIQPYRDVMFYVPFQHLFLLGPFVFFYVSSLLNPNFRVRGRLWLHFIPALLYLCFCVVVVVYDKLISQEYFFLKEGADPDFDTWYQISGLVTMIIYYVGSIRYYYLYRRAVEAVVSNAADFLFDWLRNFLFAVLFVMIAWQGMVLLGLFHTINFDVSWWYFLSFALCCYYIAIAGYSNSVEVKLFFKTGFFVTGNELFLSPSINNSRSHAATYFEKIYINTHAKVLQNPTDPELAAWKKKIEDAIAVEKFYQKPDFSLFELARNLNTNISFLSSTVNQAFACNFNDLVNGYRVVHFINLLQLGRHRKETLLALALESGFNSKTTFNRAFRKKIGQTPQQYIRQNGYSVKKAAR